MAKRKTPKVAKPSKINKEDLNSLQELVSNINQSQMQIGLLESQKHNILHSINIFNDRLLSLREKFKEDYGTDDINITDGTINKNEIN
tara:strand:- start:741 stop:1004 length:264 start_codon:yes stop_codon:yes gene_type:complete